VSEFSVRLCDALRGDYMLATEKGNNDAAGCEIEFQGLRPLDQVNIRQFNN